MRNRQLRNLIRQCGHQAGPFGNGDELVRSNHPSFRVDPSGQRLAADQLTRVEVHLRLKIGGNFTAAKRRIKFLRAYWRMRQMMLRIREILVPGEESRHVGKSERFGERAKYTQALRFREAGGALHNAAV